MTFVHPAATDINSPVAVDVCDAVTTSAGRPKPPPGIIIEASIRSLRIAIGGSLTLSRRNTLSVVSLSEEVLALTVEF